jgi:hypothetical protein
MVDGIPTLAGWLNYMKGIAIFAAAGAVTGLTFWLIIRTNASEH